MGAKAISVSQFDEIISSATKPVLIDFWASWCGPCRALSPIVEEIAAERADGLDVYKCNVDEERDLAMRFQVMSIPTLILFKEGKAVHTMVGSAPKARVLAEFEPYL